MIKSTSKRSQRGDKLKSTAAKETKPSNQIVIKKRTFLGEFKLDYYIDQQFKIALRQ